MAARGQHQTAPVARSLHDDACMLAAWHPSFYARRLALARFLCPQSVSSRRFFYFFFFTSKFCFGPAQKQNSRSEV
jgi:hypothetical protein